MRGRRRLQITSFGLSTDYSHNFAVIIAAALSKPRSLAFFLFFTFLFSSAEAAPRKVVIVALGDSTTAGTPGFRSPIEAPPEGDGDPQSQYTYWISKKHPEWTVLNHGIAGQRTDGLRDRLEGVLNQNPTYVIVLGGVNDIVQGIDPAMTTRNLAGMYREIKRRNAMPIAVSVLPFDRATTRQSQEIERLNRWIKDAADKLRIPFIDLHAVVADPSDPTKLNGSPDGLHPDVGAHRQMGQALNQLLEKSEAARPPER